MQGQLQFSAKLWPSFGEVLTGPKIQLGGFQEGLLIVGYLRRHGCAAEGGRRGPRSTTAGRVQVADTSTTWPTRQPLPPPSRSPFLDFRSDGDADARADGDGPANSYRLHAGGCEVAAAGWGAAGRGGGGCRTTACNLGPVLPQLFRVPRRKGIPTALRQQFPELLSAAGGQWVGQRAREGIFLKGIHGDRTGTAGQGRRLTRLSAFPILLAGLELGGGPLLKSVNTDPKANAGIRLAYGADHQGGGWRAMAGGRRHLEEALLLAALLRPHIRALTSCQAVLLPSPWHFATSSAVYHFSAGLHDPQTRSKPRTVGSSCNGRR